MTDLGLDELRRAGIARGDFVAMAIAPGIGLGLAAGEPPTAIPVATADPAAAVRSIEDELHPRWVMWSNEVALLLAGAGVRLATCWDLAGVQRLLSGGWRADPALVWAQLHQLDTAAIPTPAAIDLFNQGGDSGGSDDAPVRSDGYLRPEWLDDAWTWTPGRLGEWACIALRAATLQQQHLLALAERPAAPRIARSESAAELLCAELAIDGLPIDRTLAERIVAGFVGPRPQSYTQAVAERAERDADVLRHAPHSGNVDLRNPAQVKSLLRSIGVELSDTRAWRLEAIRGTHPLIEALLQWRKAERVATTFGYAWLDENVGADGRLRGVWTGCDGAAGRMTASNGLHNMPAHLREAVIAEPGHVFVRADLGQIEPRVLAAVSGDTALVAATAQDDMYAPVAEQLGVERAIAKVAVLGAMYGQTTGTGAQALRRLQQAYPVAMAYLEGADQAGQVGREVRTFGGRLIRTGSTNTAGMSDQEGRSRAAARGRFMRNAVVQGAAAEFFKLWAVTVRARGAELGASIVLCLHDELLVHTPIPNGEAVAALLLDCLDEAAHRWRPPKPARFVADVSVIQRWSDAKT